MNSLHFTIDHINKHIIEYGTVELLPGTPLDSLNYRVNETEMGQNYVRYTVLHNFKDNGALLSYENRVIFEKEMTAEELIEYLPLALDIVAQEAWK